MSASAVRLTALSLALSVLAACGSDSKDITVPPVTTVSTVTITPGTATVQVDSTLQLRVTVQGSNGSELAGEAVAWASSDTVVALVDALGRVRARRSGTATISALSGGKKGDATVTVPVRSPVATLLAVNGVAVAGTDTIRAQDTLSVRVRVTPGDGPPREITLVRTGRDSVPEILAVETLTTGGTEDVVLRALSAPSGRGRIVVRVRAGTETVESAAVPVALSRPTDIVRILSINGVPADSLHPTAVADSFRVRLRITTADGGQPTSRVFLVDRRGGTDTHIGRLSRGFAPGTTTDTVFTAYVARTGSYTIRAYTSVDVTQRAVYSSHYPVTVVQSDVTAPVITPVSPVDGSTVTTSPLDITWDMSDNRAIWTHGIEVNLNPGMNGCASSGTVIPGALDAEVRRVSRRSCGLVAGPNAITIFVIDASGNRAARSIVVNYVP